MTTADRDPGLDQATTFVLFGAAGDLSKRMVLPAFATLARKGLLPDRWRLIGTGRREESDDEFRNRVRAALEEFGPQPDDGWDDFAARLSFAGGGFTSADPGRLPDAVAAAGRELGDDVRLVHYLALPPAAFGPTTQALADHGLTEGARVVYEKPYGTSADDFRALDELVHHVLDESQVFRIDHFLGKEATQNLHVLRFANRIFAGMWCRDYVAEVQIDVPETLDVADRAEFYDATGAVRDMLVTHLFQVAAEVAMEPPGSMGAEDLQSARDSVMASFRPLDPDEVVLGQYEGYRDLPDVADNSRTDTFVAAKLWVDTDRWRGVPFLLRTGKSMAVGAQQVSLVLREPEGPFSDVPRSGNVVRLSLAGGGRIDLAMVLKAPGADLALAEGTARLDLADVAEPLAPYVSLLHDVLVGDRSLFTSADGLAHAWRAAAPILDTPPEPVPYAAGSCGPEGSERLAAPGGWVLDA